MNRKTSTITKAALSVSLVLLAVWFALGATSTLAWFSDQTDTVNNDIVIGDVNLELYHKVDTGSGNFRYLPVDESTELFEEKDLYEPGFTKVVMLKVVNNGNVPFDYKLSVKVNSYIDATAVTGDTIHLPDHLKFGVVMGKDEAEINQKVADRGGARGVATLAMDDFDTTVSSLKVGETEYAAMVVYMPEEVENYANYRGNVVPEVDLGIAALASQQGTLH